MPTYHFMPIQKHTQELLLKEAHRHTSLPHICCRIHGRNVEKFHIEGKIHAFYKEQMLVESVPVDSKLPKPQKDPKIYSVMKSRKKDIFIQQSLLFEYHQE